MIILLYPGLVRVSLDNCLFFNKLPSSCPSLAILAELAQRLLKYQMTYMEKLQEEEQTTPIIIMMLPGIQNQLLIIEVFNQMYIGVLICSIII